MKVLFETGRWEAHLCTFRPSELVTLLALALVADRAPERVEFRTGDLVAVTGLTRQTFQKCLRELAKRKVLQVLHCEAGAGGTTAVALSDRWIQVRRK